MPVAVAAEAVVLAATDVEAAAEAVTVTVEVTVTVAEQSSVAGVLDTVSLAAEVLAAGAAAAEPPKVKS